MKTCVSLKNIPKYRDISCSLLPTQAALLIKAMISYGFIVQTAFFQKNSPALCPEKEGHFLFCFLRSHTVSPARSTVGSRMRAGR